MKTKEENETHVYIPCGIYFQYANDVTYLCNQRYRTERQLFMKIPLKFVFLC